MANNVVSLKKVENKTLGKIIRTIGFLLYGFSMLIFLFELLKNIEMQVDALNNIIESLYNIGLTMFIVSVCHIAGLIMISWALGKNMFHKILLTVLLIILLVSFAFDNAIYVYGISSLSVPAFLEPITNIFSNLSNVFDGATILLQLVILFFVWHLLAYKRPRRFSTILIRVSFTVLTLASVPTAIFYFVGTPDVAIIQTIINYVWVIWAGLGLMGSLFGIIGFVRK